MAITVAILALGGWLGGGGMPAFPRCPNCFNIYDGAGCEKKSCNYVPWAGPTVAQADKSDVIRAIQANGAALEYASDAMKADREVVMLAVKKHGLALQYATMFILTPT